MDVSPAAPTLPGPPHMFEGAVYLDSVFAGNEHSRLRVSLTHFAPGARTVWHQHALGQVLHVTEGRGIVQSRGGEPVEVGPGDTVHSPPGEWHWHGATNTHFMTHLAVWEGVAPDAGEPETVWGEPVTDQ